jgi:hypothetical protein
MAPNTRIFSAGIAYQVLKSITKVTLFQYYFEQNRLKKRPDPVELITRSGTPDSGMAAGKVTQLL